VLTLYAEYTMNKFTNDY